ncbi:GNAT family N-acetyltransferase [Alkaliphilus transvaalensis]|uniref:GNAT family N-acetyltransferase n=1 Tax=Alkaliphilus transvaalensis TaxID=114628 RepID=UPI00047C953E|nr:GNAT family N-acetyltransferase [Alkaliphilus transvaalensis]
MNFIELKKEDIPELAELYVEAFNAEPWKDQWTVERASKRLLQMLNCEGFYGLVASEDDKLIGMILGNHEYFYDGMHFNIKEFCVDLKLRKSGVGSALLNEFLDRLKKKGINEVILFTSRTDGTEGFYHKRGFNSFNSMVMMGKEL